MALLPPITMTSGAPPSPKKKSRQPAPTTIFALGDDLLREIFLHLPSLSSLVRAALACPAFLRAVRSSPAFRRCFRDLHWPPLLGVFLVNDEPPMPTFAPILLRRLRRSHPDHAAALRGLDVFLTLLPDALLGDQKDDSKDADEDVEEEGEDEIEWSISGCRDGYVLVTQGWNTKKVAVYDPVTRALHVCSTPEVFSGESGYNTKTEFHVISSETDDRSFRLLCVCKKRRVAEKRGATWRKQKKVIWGAQVAVFSPDTREWQIFPTAGSMQIFPTCGSLQDACNGTLVNGFVYWQYEDGDNVLNTSTLQFSHIDLPGHMSGFSYSPENLKAGENKDGELCFVGGSGLELDLLVRRAGDDGVDRWMKDKTFWLWHAIDNFAINIIDECPGMNVVAIIGGIVYFSIHQENPPIWLLSFCLETRELKKLCRITSYKFCYPYIMAFPPSLVRNKVGAV